MEKQQGIKIFFVLLISTVFIFSFSHFGALGYEAMTADNDRFSPGTSIGSVNVSAKTQSEALTLVTNQLQTWQNETSIDLTYKEKIVPVNLELYQFDVQSSVNAAQSGQDNPMIATIDEKVLHEQLDQIAVRLIFTEKELTAVYQELLRYGTNLTVGNHQVSLQSVLATEESNELINETRMNLDRVSVLMSDWMEELSPIIIPAESRVSFIDMVEEHQLSSMPAEVMSMIATGIYQTVLPTNFTVLERHISQELPDYVALGYEAKVNQDANLDFVFANSNGSEYRLEFQWANPTLTIQLIGSPLLYNYTITESAKQEFAPKTVIQYSPQLLPSETAVKKEGKAGQLINISRTVYGEFGELVTKERLAEDYYAPVEKIEIHGLSSPSTNNPEEGSIGTDEGIEDGTNSPSEIEQDEENDEENTPENPDSNNGNSDNPDRESDSDEFWGKPNEEEK